MQFEMETLKKLQTSADDVVPPASKEEVTMLRWVATPTPANRHRALGFLRNERRSTVNGAHWVQTLLIFSRQKIEDLEAERQRLQEQNEMLEMRLERLNLQVSALFFPPLRALSRARQ